MHSRQQVTSLPTAMGLDCLANAIDFRQPRASMLREQRSRHHRVEIIRTTKRAYPFGDWKTLNSLLLSLAPPCRV